MAQYQKVEYRIRKDGKITETLVNASGPSCTADTEGVEEALGQVISQELLPEYYEGSEHLSTEETQSLTQQ